MKLINIHLKERNNTVSYYKEYDEKKEQIEQLEQDILDYNLKIIPLYMYAILSTIF